ncbi:hypothetical protein ZOSMA_81G00710 [Zostera marina]|uniref:Defensin-like protein n=1 Tax=Zostera marina TaxID=29655 RepID=A0A0K9NML8_ZOSMR|nr:hypothetical protein ZOSMA_81G00710 [Zostera marina]
MIPENWCPPCGNLCTKKYAALTQIPWRVFCKKGCDADGDTWEECLEECDGICFKDPVLKNQQWSAFIDRSPGSEKYSVDCFHACVSGCSYKFDIAMEEAEKIQPNRPLKQVSVPPPKSEVTVIKPQLSSPMVDGDDIPCTSA